ncbi:MAG: hypothetical protein CMH83_08840 [Nocardioides sp.]|nr:hypothetical protein [Nocardioides sp.]
MFGRSKSGPTTSPEETVVDADARHTQGKGRPTPTRKEAEAAAKARNKPARSRKEQAQRQRAARAEQTRKMRDGMKSGDERYLLARDKGPVRRFTRDFVDVRFSFAEVVIPLMLISLIVPNLVVPVFAVLLVDLVILRMRLRKQLKQRFPDESYKGTTFYAITRAMQLRFLRLPKTARRIGEPLPEHYR